MSFPEEYQMSASRWSAVGLFLACTFFAFTSFYARNGEHPALSWVMTFIFLACLPVLAMNIFRPPSLKLSSDGITIFGWRSEKSYPWESLIDIRAKKMPGGRFLSPKRVWFRIDPAVMGPTESKLGLLTNNNGMLASNFGYTADQLAEMLLAFQARALARQSDER